MQYCTESHFVMHRTNIIRISWHRMHEKASDSLTNCNFISIYSNKISNQCHFGWHVAHLHYNYPSQLCLVLWIVLTLLVPAPWFSEHDVHVLWWMEWIRPLGMKTHLIRLEQLLFYFIYILAAYTTNLTHLFLFMIFLTLTFFSYT